MEPRRNRLAGRRLVEHARERLFAVADDGDARTPVAASEPEQRAAFRILNFALRAGALMLSSGAGTVEVESTILALCQASGLRNCDVDVTFTSMTASYVRGDDVEPVTAVRVVRHRRVDYNRLNALYQLREDVTHGRVTFEEAFARLDEIEESPSRRSRQVVLAWAGMAAAFTVLLGGDALVAAVAFVSTCLGYFANRRLERRSVPDFFKAATGAAIATTFAVALNVLGAPVVSAVVVAGGIMVLVPGYALVASVQDALTGFPISGSARGLEVLITAAGIVSGVAFVLYVTASTGFSGRLEVLPAPSLAELPPQVFAAGVASALYAAATSAPRRALAAAGAVGALGWLLFLLLQQTGSSLVVSNAVAALVVGVSGRLLANRQGTHPFLYIVPGVMPLVPGLAIYEAMLHLVYGHGRGINGVLQVVAAGMAIAAGVTLGRILIEPLRRPRHRSVRLSRPHLHMPRGDPPA